MNKTIYNNDNFSMKFLINYSYSIEIDTKKQVLRYIFTVKDNNKYNALCFSHKRSVYGLGFWMWNTRYGEPEHREISHYMVCSDKHALNDMINKEIFKKELYCFIPTGIKHTTIYTFGIHTLTPYKRVYINNMFPTSLMVISKDWDYRL